MTPEVLKRGLALGALTMVGSLGIDMYLPAIPQMAQELHAPIGTAQFTLTTYLLALAVGQPLYGPLSDRFGRRLPMTLGLALFGLASLGCAVAQSMELLIGLRFVQGLGASALMVVSRAMVRDLCTGATAVRLLAIMMAVIGVAPVLSPVLGAYVAETTSWRFLFAGLAVMSLPGFAILLWLLPETLTPERRVTGGLREIGLAVRELGADRRFLGLILMPGLTQAATFAFVASSAFVFVELLGMSPSGYSIIFAITAIVLICGAQFAGGAVERFGMERVILTAITVDVVAAFVMLAAVISGQLSIGIACTVFLLIFGTIGFIGSPASVAALEPHHRIAGTAAALSGAANMLLGALGSGLASSLIGSSALPLALVMVAANAAALGVAAATFLLMPPAPVDQSPIL
jgi:DHA1 family bicyclomycin/chloramphenicol resistance-like MFS transporter